MTDQNQIRNQFREDEVAIIKHWDKQRQEYVSNVYPKVGGRLRMAHEANDAINIETEIIRYDGSLAVVVATCQTLKGSFKGIGMSSADRDPKINPAILELAETRAIARCLRFAGYGVEYCSAEEVSHLENGNNSSTDNGKAPDNSSTAGGNGNNRRTPDKGNGNGGNANGNNRISPKQYKYILSLADDRNLSHQELNRQALSVYGVSLEHLNRSDASQMIQELQNN